jgi:hypothetical protein
MTCTRVKKYFSLFLAFIFFYNSSFLTFSIFIYYTNKNYIAKNLCQLKNSKENTCLGKCQLKKIKAEYDKKNKEADHNTLVKTWLEWTIFFNSIVNACIFQRNHLLYMVTSGFFLPNLIQKFVYKELTPPPWFAQFRLLDS